MALAQANDAATFPLHPITAIKPILEFRLLMDAD